MPAVKESITGLIQKALALRKEGRIEEARKILEKSLKLEDKNKELLLNLGVVYMELRNAELAQSMFDRAYKLDAQDAQVCYYLGVIALVANHWLRAYEYFLEAVRWDPMHRGVWVELVRICFNRKDKELMERYSKEFVARWPDDLEGLCNLAVIYFDDKNYKAVIELCRSNAEWLKKSWQINQLLGASLMELKKYDEAIPYFKRSMEINPYNDNVLYNFASCYERMRDFETALSLVNRSLELRPNGADAWNLKGIISARLGKMEEALSCYDKAIYYEPNNDGFCVNRAYQYLLQGDYSRGFKEFEHRFGVRSLYPDQSLRRRAWQGEAINDKRVLIAVEQGFGDSLQFVRYISMLKEKLPTCTLFLVARESLKTLFEYNFSKWATVVTRNNMPNYDVMTAPMSLPYIFKTTIDTVPAIVPYIRAPEASIKKWKAMFGNDAKKRIGIVWTGSTLHKHDDSRSTPLAVWKPLLAMKDCLFISLQVEYRANDLQEATQYGVRDFSKQIEDFSDTAGIIDNLDLVITVDTSVAHLAGAMGKPVWVVLPKVSEWRWLEKREDSPWYSTVRLFRQTSAKGWTDVFATVGEELQNFKHNRKL